MDKSNQVKSNEYYSVSRDEMLDFIPVVSTSVLDVGCGSGVFGASIKRRHPSTIVWGIEPNEDAARAAVQVLDRVIVNTFSNGLIHLEGEKFSVICLNDVLEHMIDPDQALAACKNLLTDKGIVVASIPNILYFYEISNILVSQDWKYKEFGILDNTHLRFFTKKSILRMFDEAGYEVLNIEGINAFAGRKYKFFNVLTLGHIRDWKYLQFAVQARVKK